MLDTVISTTEGAYKGLNHEGILSWKGIRYAKAPVGHLRWRAPESPEGFTGIREAYNFGNICPQRDYDSRIYNIPPEPHSEDCLFLNVWSQKKSMNSKKAVIVWIHGGRLIREGGSTPLYNGHHLAKKDIVFVSINYRLNVFGFFSHPDLIKENPDGLVGNYGLLDQIKALEWIKDNIAKFNGDPNNITLMGESAGAWSISLLMTTEKAKGLFQRAILQSGAYLWKGPHVTEDLNGYLSASEEGKRFAKLLGVDTVDELRLLPAEQLVEIVFSKDNPLSCEPVIDGQLFKDFIPNLFKKGLVQQYDVLIGTNADEWSVFSYGLPECFFEKFHNRLKTKCASGYEEWLQTYLSKPSDTIESAYNNYRSDLVFHKHGFDMANYALKWKRNTYVYYFGQKSVNKNYEVFGAYHGAEIPFVFQTLEAESDGGEIPNSGIQYSEIISDYWMNFAKKGNPNGDRLPQWPQWHPEKQACMLFEDQVRSKEHPLKERIKGLNRFQKKEPHEKLTGLILKTF